MENPKRKRKKTKQETVDMLRDEVFQDEDFLRQIEETAAKENIPVEVVTEIMQDFITKTALEIIKPTKIKKRISIMGFFNIEILRPRYNANSKIFKRKNKLS